jgi:cyclopropane fatty-acyl-phospholipid synthase-like methyltransferase
MTKNFEYWKNFWNSQSTPCHRHGTDEWYDRYAREVNLILESAGYDGGPVLETGCGNGALFNSLNINKSDYVGTDISDSLLDAFRTNHPELKLICTDSASYQNDRQFSLIFSNGVVQYFDRKQMDEYITNSLAMLGPNGVLLLGNVLWKDLQAKFYSGGELSGKLGKGSPVASAKVFLRELMGKPVLGYWYNPRDFIMYQREGVEAQVFGSLFYPYRFSLVLKKSS